MWSEKKIKKENVRKENIYRRTFQPKRKEQSDFIKDDVGEMKNEQEQTIQKTIS